MKRFFNVLMVICLLFSFIATSAITASAQTEENTISEVMVSGVTDAVVGKAATVEGITISEDSNYTLVSAEWSTDNSDEAFNGVFEDATNYYLLITLSPEEGYVFDQYASVTTNSNAINDYFIFEGSMIIVISYSFPDYIETVTMTGVIAPVIGEAATIEDITIPEDANYALEGVNWLATSDGTVENAAKWESNFEAGKHYILAVTLSAMEDCEFTDDLAITINGEAVSADKLVMSNFSETEAVFYYSFGELEDIQESESSEAPAVPDNSDDLTESETTTVPEVSTTPETETTQPAPAPAPETDDNNSIITIMLMMMIAAIGVSSVVSRKNTN